MNQLRQFFSGRPLPVTIVAVFVLCITIWNGIRVWSTIANWNTLLRFDGNPFYTFGSGLAWFIAGLVLLASLQTRRSFGWHVTVILSMIYMIWYWVDRLIIQASPTGNLIFSAVASMTIFVTFHTFLLSPSSRAFFTRRPHE